jgi:hypothetical protein
LYIFVPPAELQSSSVVMHLIWPMKVYRFWILTNCFFGLNENSAVVPHTTSRSTYSTYIRGVFKKYRTFGRQKYIYWFGGTKP